MYYFAYGLLLNKKLMAGRCPDCKSRFAADLPNYKLIFSGWSRQWKGGTVSIKRSARDRVLGGVYEIADKDLSRLDAAEGCPDTNSRLKVTVYRDSGEAGEAVEAFTYIRTRPAEESKPSPEYLAELRKGYHDWGLI